MHTKAQCSHLSLPLSLLVLWTAGCEPPARPLPTTFHAFWDRSASIDEASKRAWIEQDMPQLLGELAPRDQLRIFGVDGYTAEARPILEDRLPERGTTMATQVKYQASHKQLLDRSRAVASAWLAGTPATHTDLLSAFDRIARPPSGHVVIAFFSDMRHSSTRRDEPDLETTALAAERLDAVIAQVLRARGWRADQLRDVEVRCHLDTPHEPTRESRTPGAKRDWRRAAKHPPRNDRRALQAFWGALVQAMGGRLTFFDNTRLSAASSPPERAARDRYAASPLETLFTGAPHARR